MNLSEVHSLSPAFPDVDERRKRDGKERGVKRYLCGGANEDIQMKI